MWYSSEDDFTYVDIVNGRLNQELVRDVIPAFREGVIPTVGNTTAYEEFDITLREETAQITLPVANDGETEEEETATFTLEEGEDYDVDTDAETSIFTIVDTVEDPLPNVALGAFPNQVVEGDTLTLFFEVANIPEEGLYVYVDSQKPQSLSQFDLENAGVPGGESLILNPDLSGFAVKIFTDNPQIELPVIIDEIAEETIEITYELKTRSEISAEELAAVETVEAIGEYTINPLLEATIEVLDEIIPNVALGAFPNQVLEGDTLTLFFEFSDIPEDGLYIYVDSETPQSLSQFSLEDAVVTGGDFLVVNPDLSGFAVKILTDNAQIELPVIVDEIAEEPIEITYELKTREEISPEDLAAVETVENIGEYTINPLMMGEAVIISDAMDLIVSIEVTQTVLIEEEETPLTITLTANRPIPDEGVIVSIDSDVENALGQFDLLRTQFDNVALLSVNDDLSGFVVRLTEQTGTIRTPVVDDDNDDGTQVITFRVESDEAEVDQENASVTLTIEDNDTREPEPQPPSSVDFTQVFGSLQEDVIEVQGQNQLIFAGDSNDLIDASLGSPFVTSSLEEATITEINQGFDTGALTSEMLVEFYLERIEAFDQSVNSIITLNEDALATAMALDVERQTSGPRSPLHGIPILLKDNIDTFDLPTSAGSLILQDSIAQDDAFVVEQLRSAGAIILGKTNLDEFARGISGLSSLGGQTLNPYDLNREPGGSSAGTAAGVASNFATFGLGTETGVSLRNPAADNNLVAIAPTEGLVSRDGVVPISFTQDRVGPLARTVTNAAIALDVMAGFDENDPVTEQSLGNIPEAGYTSLLSTTALEGSRIGVFRDLFRSGTVHEESLAIIDDAIEDFQEQGATIIDNVSLGFDLFDFLSDARASIFEFKFALNDYLESLGSDAPVQTLQDILDDGRFLPSIGNTLAFSQSIESLEDNADYLERLSRREFLQNATIDIMEQLDLDALIYPMKTVSAPLIGQTAPESDNSFTSIAGLPGIVVPAGFTSEGLPVGLEISGKPFSEASLLGFAYDYEQATLHRTSPTELNESLFSSNGNNRIYAQSGDDTLILGRGDRLFGGDGDDSFFALSEGDNIITGGAGADQFWLATAEIPDTANTITDFISGEDVIGIGGLGIGFDDLSITQQGDDTLIAFGDNELGKLLGVNASILDANNFVFT